MTRFAAGEMDIGGRGIIFGSETVVGTDLTFPFRYLPIPINRMNWGSFTMGLLGSIVTPVWPEVLAPKG